MRIIRLKYLRSQQIRFNKLEDARKKLMQRKRQELYICVFFLLRKK